MRLSFFPTSFYHYYTKLLSLNFVCRWTHTHMASPTPNRRHRSNQKILIIMGPTGAGKSRLSVDHASRFFTSSEIINSDKIQVYKGLNITTNKITMQERLNVKHHLLGEIDPSEPEFTPSKFRSHTTALINNITSRRKLPIIVGGSNSFIYALVSKHFKRDVDVFNGLTPLCSGSELRYRCCFLCVDVSLPVLNKYLLKRVDEMMDLGMFDELSDFFESKDYENSVSGIGLRKAIGVPEFERYFKRFGGGRGANPEEDAIRRLMYEEAVNAIKENTCQLARRQLEKIQRLRDAGWDLHRIDATEVFRAAIGEDADGMSDLWEKKVVEPSVKIVKHFLEE